MSRRAPRQSAPDPQEITGVRRFSYEFLDAPPAWLAKSADVFARDISAAIEEQD